MKRKYIKKTKPTIITNPELIDDILNEEAEVINKVLTECYETASEVMEEFNTDDIESNDEDVAEDINEVLNTATLTE